MAGEETCYDATYQRAGDECSSTLEGRHVNIFENLLVHPSHPDDDLVDKGDPVVVQMLVGVALGSATSEDDAIVVETEGVWYLIVEAGKQGMGDIHVGTMLFIDPVTAVISDDWEGIPFGHALAPIDDGQAALIAVKVHAFQILFPWWFFL